MFQYSLNAPFLKSVPWSAYIKEREEGCHLKIFEQGHAFAWPLGWFSTQHIKILYQRCRKHGFIPFKKVLHLPFNISTIVHFGFTKRERELNNSNQDRNVMHRVDLLLCRMEKSELCPLYTSLFYLKVSHIFWIAKVYGRWCRSSFTKTSVPAKGVLNQSKTLPGGGHTHVKAHSHTRTST